MKRTKTAEKVDENRSIRQPLTPEAKEDQMIGLAMELAEQQLLDGTASSQVITHYLKLGTRKYRKEIEELEKEIELKDAKIRSLERSENMEQMFADAIKAMSIYKGEYHEEEYE